MEGSDWVALAAVVVAGLSVIVTGLSILVNHRGSEKRLAHEKELQEQRLVHERREAVRTTAVDAYVRANAALRVVHALDNLVTLLTPERVVEDLRDSLTGLEEIVALGWSAEVRETAQTLMDALGEAITKAIMAATAARMGRPDADNLVEDFWTVYQTAHDANEAYRETISAD